MDCEETSEVGDMSCIRSQDREVDDDTAAVVDKNETAVVLV